MHLQVYKRFDPLPKSQKLDFIMDQILDSFLFHLMLQEKTIPSTHVKKVSLEALEILLDKLLLHFFFQAQ